MSAATLTCSAGSALVQTPHLVTLSMTDLDSRLLDDPARSAWLTERELRRWSELRVPKRKREWLAGRIAAKESVRDRHQVSPSRIEIGSIEEGLERGRPFYAIDGRRGELCLSIAHAADVALAALGQAPGEMVGVDVERVCQRDASFESVALARSEIEALRDLHGDERWRAVTLVWVLKEALLKALGVGLRVPLPRLAVRLADGPAEGLDQVPAATLFSISDSIRHLHPHLRRFERLTLSASTFELGDAVGAWIVLPSWDR